MINRIFALPKYVLKTLYALLILIFLVAVILACGVWWLSSDNGQSYVHKMIKEQFSKEVGYQIQAEDVSFHFPMNMKINNLSLSDQKGKWLDIKNISVNILLNPNIYKHLIIRNFSIDKFALLRKPQEAKINGNKEVKQKTEKTIEDKNHKKYDIKISVNNINIKEIIIASSLANLPKDAKLSINGEILWDNLSQSLTFSNSLKLGQIVYYVSPIKLNLSGKYLLEDSNSKTPKISANIKNEKIKIGLPNPFSTSPGEDTQKKYSPAANTQNNQSHTSKTDNQSIILDMLLDVDDNIFISGYGLDLAVGGKLKITGDANNPIYKGRLGMAEGIFKQFGRDFKLQKADLVFNGHIPPYPYLDVVGTANIEGIEIIPSIIGPLTSPSLKVDSSSSNKDIISKLLFKDGKSKINTTEIKKSAKKAEKEVAKAFESFFK
ncbi:MAG: translocation/assembly module TamB [Rickettsiales bacterium]|jgi:autotransporter translocation and assembly factor TamB|nr:translocation/assembly module TamB [Rickettsiales bacterium]